MVSMLLSTGSMSDSNWDATLNGWNGLTSPPSNINIGTVTPTHTIASQTAYDNLINTFNWTIND